MRRVLEQPLKVYRVAVPLLIATWYLAGIAGENSTPSKDGTKYLIASRSWALFLITLLTTVLFTIALGVSRVLRRSS